MGHNDIPLCCSPGLGTRREKQQIMFEQKQSGSTKTTDNWITLYMKPRDIIVVDDGGPKCIYSNEVPLLSSSSSHRRAGWQALMNMNYLRVFLILR